MISRDHEGITPEETQRFHGSMFFLASIDIIWLMIGAALLCCKHFKSFTWSLISAIPTLNDDLLEKNFLQQCSQAIIRNQSINTTKKWHPWVWPSGQLGGLRTMRSQVKVWGAGKLAGHHGYKKNTIEKWFMTSSIYKIAKKRTIAGRGQ